MTTCATPHCSFRASWWVRAPWSPDGWRPPVPACGVHVTVPATRELAAAVGAGGRCSLWPVEAEA